MERMKLPKKPDSVANALRDAILSGQIECGVELTQVELAESLGVSRMPVRDIMDPGSRTRGRKKSVNMV